MFDARDLVPVAGAREDGLPGITTPLERMLQPAALHQLRKVHVILVVYGKEGSEIIVVQQRSPVLKVHTLNAC